MPKRCGCGDTCACVIEPGPGATVEGNGTVGQPYVIGVAGSELDDRVIFDDSETVDFTTVGPGTPSAAMHVSALAKLKLTDLTDVETDPPNSGEVPVWQGSEWVFQPPPVAPPGAVNVSNGIGGDGSVATPLKALTSGVFGTAPLTTPRYAGTQNFGDEIYIDGAGNLRSRPQVLWTNLAGNALPSAYPMGQSIVTVNAANAATWLAGTDYGTVVTIKRMETSGGVDNGQTQQWWYKNNSNEVQYRQAANDAGGWGAWVNLNMEDTGWIALTPASGTGTFQWRCRMGTVSVRVGLSGVTSIAAGASGSISGGVIPAAYVPGVSVYAMANLGGSSVGQGTINSGSGSISCWNSSAGATTTVRFQTSWLKE